LVDGGRIAYDVTGEGPLVVLSHGMGDTRTSWRFPAPQLVKAGYRLATADLRGIGESSVAFPTYTRTATAGDLAALIRHLGGPAVVVGHSYSGGAATILAAHEPDLVSAIVELESFTRAQKINVGGLLRNHHHRKGMRLLFSAGIFGSVKLWARYLDHAYPVVKPADWEQQIAAMRANLTEPGRMKALQAMGPDWADAPAEAEGIAAGMPAGLATVAVIDGAGHYPQVQYPAQVTDLLLPFLKQNTKA
jgi:pimeloyl-ACP methyl ester carboxylesterase